MPKQRLYIDESGDHSCKGVQEGQWDKRYLCLLGCAFEIEYCRNSFSLEFEAFKERHFGAEMDEPVILHREELMAKTGPFKTLKDQMKSAAFRTDLLGFLESARFRVFAVVIDKLRTTTKEYGLCESHPYHLGLLAMLERYCGWLSFSRQDGDALAEARGGREDMLLKAAYREIWAGGSRYRDPGFFQKTLSSGEIKIKRKVQNIAGLQVADLLAYPAKRRILEEEAIAPPTSGFTKDIADVLESKYNRRYANSQVTGYGKICLF